MRKLLSTLSSILQGGVRGGLLFLALVATTSLLAYDFQFGDLYYNITSNVESYTVEVTSQLSSEPYNEDVAITSITIPSTVTYNGTTYNVTSIGEYAFDDCSGVTSITIPKSVKSIEWRAFHNCSSLNSIIIPKSVTNIVNYSFAGCDNLLSIVVEKGNPTYDSRDNCNAIIKTATNTLVVGCKNTIIPNSITGIEDHAFSGCSGLTSITIPESVTSIGNSAFYGCSSLTSITIPNSVTNIGYAAFAGCHATSITIPNGVTNIEGSTFYDCSSLTSITIPNSVTSIGFHAFRYCRALTSITIPESVTSIGENAFEYCTFTRNNFINNSSLNAKENQYWGATIYEENGLCIVDSVVVDCLESATSVIIPDTIIEIGNEAFFGCSGLTSITIPESVTSIGEWAFGGCSSLTSITIPNSVTNIGESAFEGCHFIKNNFINNSTLNAEENQYWGATIYEENGLCIVDSVVVDCLESATSVVIPDTIIAIGDFAFEECSSLASVTIPNSVKSIGEGAFFECVSLTSIMIPNSVINIGEIAFVYCSSLANMTVEVGNTIYDSRNNCNAIIETATNKLIAGCKNTTIPTNVTSIGMNAFYACPITSITIPNSVTTIGAGAFAECDLLKSLAIPRSVTTLGEAAFALCESLILLDIPNTVSRIGMDAFAETGIYNNKSNWDNGVLYISNCLIEAQRDISGNYTVKKDTRLIADGAFYRCYSLHSITIPENVASVGELAFSRCSELNTVTCLATTPPILGKEAFLYCDDPVLFVLCESQADYQSHEQWRQFSSVQCIASEEVETDDVVINTGSTSVTITWPTDPNAETYVIVIKQGDKVFCSLTFNADGMLLNIAFAPSRDGNHPAQYAEAVANGKGFRFTVTDLEEGTDYTYDIVVKNEANQVIETHSGEFTTESMTAVENTHSQSPMTNCQKLLRKGQLIILRDGLEYNAVGVRL